MLTGSLLATDRSDVPVFDLGMGFQGLISVHDFGLTGNTFSSFDLTIRYDEAAAGEFESDLQVFHYTGGAWLPVTTGLDLANNLITAGGLTSFSLFGVGYAIPEPGTLALAAVAGLALLRRHR
ncbi:MAG: hypothetical protein BWZ02_02806 [Lentisphaerae bacterium ADurb.BinA184]|nr:MAG: hypothetical protein BWZ02_02806 [Lentisphaerae bacterium ADurb.BinA184]